MLFFPNAKINLGLNIVSKRNDGYHNIETVFCPIELSDVLEFVPSPGDPDGQVTFTSTGIPVDGPVENNLCVKAYHLLAKDFNLPALAVHLHKIIPMGAGLGGGSSDAAFMLKHLSIHFNLNIPEDDLCRYASVLGSDCAFFIKNRPLFGYERGNVFKEISLNTENLRIIVINPGIHVSTADAYAGVQPAAPENSLVDLVNLPVSQWKEFIVNDFERTVFIKHPEIGAIKEKLYESGAEYASMSGSGSSVFGIFAREIPDLESHFGGLFAWKGKIINGR